MGKQRKHPSDKRKLSASEQKLKAVIQQLRTTEQQLKATNQQLEAGNQQLRASEEELRKLNRDLGERVKELNCFYGLSQLVEQHDITLEEIFQGLVGLIPPAWQYPDITAARIIFENSRFQTKNFRKTAWMQSADIKVHGQKAGSIEVCYLKKRPVIDEGPFLKEERKVLDVLVERLGCITERISAEKELRETHNYLERLINHANAPIIVWDPKFKITRFNHAFERLTGYPADEVVGQKLSMLFPKASREESLGNIKRTLRGEYWESVEIPILRKDGDIRVALWNSANIYSEDDTTLLATIAQGQDITERKQAEEALRAINQQLRASEQQLKAANEQLRASEQQLKAANEQLRASEQQLKATNQQLQASEQQLKAANQQLQASEQQLKALASQLTLAEESERHRIATELHATIGQSLAVSKLQLDILRASIPSGDIAKTLGEVCDLLDETIQGTRSLTFNLSSPILYELGFEKAVAEWLTERIQQKYGIATEFEDDGQPKPLDDEVCVFLFRDVRELLINVVKHAQAKKVKVSVRRVSKQIQVSVEDDGWGFDPEKIAATAVRRGGFGLFSIRERLEQLGGELEIESAPGHGTRVTIMAPLKEEKVDEGKKR